MKDNLFQTQGNDGIPPMQPDAFKNETEGKQVAAIRGQNKIIHMLTQCDMYRLFY